MAPRISLHRGSPSIDYHPQTTAPRIERVPWSTSSISAAMADAPIHTMTRDSRVTLAIPLDGEPPKSLAEQRRDAQARRELKGRIVEARDGLVAATDADGDAFPVPVYRRASEPQSQREPRRRDSLKRREALLRGKEGSRRRQKWENDRLLGNPAFQPPEPHDWLPHPTHPVHSVPYVLAPLWDAHYQKRQAQRSAEEAAQPRDPLVPRDVRDRLKRNKAARGLLQQLEEQVRSFVAQHDAHDPDKSWVNVGDDSADDGSGSEEEVVFVGRRRQPLSRQDEPEARAPQTPRSKPRDKLVFDSPANDAGAAFGRWLVHSLAAYYKLDTWSVTTGDPARREAYVGLPEGMAEPVPLPRPMYVSV